jgi:hypothetical protein
MAARADQAASSLLGVVSPTSTPPPSSAAIDWVCGQFDPPALGRTLAESMLG